MTSTEHGAIRRDPRLLVVSQDPFNAETPVEVEASTVTPNGLFYVRNHFAVPALESEGWSLRVEGAVERSQIITYAELLTFPQRTLTVTLECAGNGRRGFEPPVPGEPWAWGAVSTATWSGVPLQVLLERAVMLSGARDIVFEGADQGSVRDAGGVIPFARSLTPAQALGPDPLLAVRMNGEPLPPDHGFPVRLIVPGWYGMASVKWLTRIVVLTERFAGFYQRDRYVLHGPNGTEPLTTMAVRAVITSPSDGAELPRGRHWLRGFAWSGTHPVARVEVSVDGGVSWSEAKLTGPPERFGRRPWAFLWEAEREGPATLLARAVDSAGAIQPHTPVWNDLGYGNNAVRPIPVRVL